MNPLKYAQMMKYLTRAKKANPDLPNVTFANKITQPPVRQDVEEIEAINRFMRANPRTEKAGGGRIGFKKKGFVNKGGEAEYQRRLKIAQDKFGKDNLDAAAKELGYKNYDALRGEKYANIRRKIFKELGQFGSVLDERESRIRSRGTRIPKEQGIQIKLLEATNNKKFFDPKAFAKENGISLKEVKRNAALLQKNIYNKRMLVAGKEMRSTLEWIPDDPTVSDNALNKLWKSKLIKYEKNKIDELFYQAFGNPKSDTYNPKKFLAIKKNLNEYRQLRDAINARFPGINFELDHPLSKSSLNKLFNATTDQLTRVNVLEADLNNGFKDTLSLQYEKAVQGNDLKKKKAVEKIARDLNLNIGKISDDATNFKYGVKEFQKLNIKDEIGKSLQNLSALNKNFQTYAKNNPDLFKIANINPNQTFTQIKPSELKGIQKMIASLGGGNCGRGLKNQGGRIGLQDGTPNVDVCFKNALERIRKGGVDFTNAEAINFNKLTKGLRVAGASNIVKFGVLPEILLEGALIADKMASEGDSFAQGLRNSYLAIPFQALGVAKTYEEGEKDRILAAAPESQRGKVLDVFNLQDKLNKKFELMGASEGFKRQIAATDAVSDGPFSYVGDSQDLQKRLSDTRADLQDLSRGDINRAERILTSSPLDLNIKDQLTMDAFKSATEKADADKASNILVAPGTGLGVDAQIRKRMKELPVTSELAKEQLQATGDFFGTGYTPFGMNELFKSLGQQDPRFGYDETGKYNEEKGLNDFINYLRNQQIADAGGVANLAGGGIAKEAGDSSGRPPVSGPNPQGLLSLKNRVRNY